MAEKTEKATPKKLRDARKKGQVAKSQDFPAAITFAVSIGSLIMFSTYFFNQISGFMLEMFHAINAPGDFGSQANAYMIHAAEVIGKTSLPMMGLVAFVGIIVNFLIIGPVFSFEAMKFDLKRLNPIEGIKQKFKLRILVDLLKSCLKISGAAIIIYFIIWKALPEIIGTVTMPAVFCLQIVSNFLFDVAIQVGIFFLLIAFFDLFFQKAQFAKDMKMEKFEVKQEYKDLEGDPQIKGKRREMFREISYQDGPPAARRARAIVTNPTHYAVAIKYFPPEDRVPMIITMGAGEIAKKILDVAVEHGIPIIRSPDLAQEMYRKGLIGYNIPKDCVKAVSEVLKWVMALEKKLEQNPNLSRETTL